MAPLSVIGFLKIGAALREKHIAASLGPSLRVFWLDSSFQGRREHSRSLALLPSLVGRSQAVHTPPVIGTTCTADLRYWIILSGAIERRDKFPAGSVARGRAMRHNLRAFDA